MRILILLLILNFSCTAHAFQNDKKGEWLNNYVGDIDHSHQIGMTLIYHGDEVHGTYFYNKSLKDINLSGKIINKNQIQLKEFNEQGNVVALFKGHFIQYANQDPRETYGDSAGKLDKEVIVGVRQKISDKTEKPFYLSLDDATYRAKGEGRYVIAGVEDDSVIEESAYAFWHAVKSDSKTQVAKLIAYPIYVEFFDGEKHKIQNKNEFIQIYDRIFTARFKKKILQSVPHNMFANYRGVMLGDGEIWFRSDGKVYAINGDNAHASILSDSDFLDFYKKQHSSSREDYF